MEWQQEAMKTAIRIGIGYKEFKTIKIFLLVSVIWACSISEA